MNFLLNAALAGRFTLQISKFNSKPTVIQGYLAKRQTDPWYRTDSRNKLTLTQSTDFQQRPQSKSIRKKVICTNGPETILKVKKKKKKKTTHISHHVKKISLRQIIDLNIKNQTTELLILNLKPTDKFDFIKI